MFICLIKNRILIYIKKKRVKLCNYIGKRCINIYKMDNIIFIINLCVYI